MNIKKYSKYLIVSIIICCITFMFILFFYLYPLKYSKYIKDYSNKYKLEVPLIASIINTESSFNKDAISSKGAVGLMQLLPSTAKWLCEKIGEEYSYKYLYNPQFNINLGSYYLKYLIEKFENIDTAIVAYNAGEGITKSWLENKEYSTNGKTLNNIPYKETKNYLKKVKNGIKIYTFRFGL